jgi:hypothetical protein
MAGLVPAIHVLPACGDKDVDARHKAGHDEDFLALLRVEQRHGGIHHHLDEARAIM